MVVSEARVSSSVNMFNGLCKFDRRDINIVVCYVLHIQITTFTRIVHGGLHSVHFLYVRYGSVNLFCLFTCCVWYFLRFFNVLSVQSSLKEVF